MIPPSSWIGAAQFSQAVEPVEPSESVVEDFDTVSRQVNPLLRLRYDLRGPSGRRVEADYDTIASGGGRRYAPENLQ